MFKTTAKQAEDKWLKLILDFLKTLYEGHWLPSHDIGHHTRVWKNAIELNALQTETSHKSEFFFEELLLACYFHDVGLLTDQSEFHGIESRRYCEEFLRNNKEFLHFDPIDVFLAIENHDRKRYNAILWPKQSEVYQTLSLADDLEAFGAIGVYRYIEIYLLRGIPIWEIAERIIQNAASRYQNMHRLLSANLNFSLSFTYRYQLLERLLDNNSFVDSALSLIEWINEKIVKPKQNNEKLISSHDWKNHPNKRIQEFIEFFNKESQL